MNSIRNVQRAIDHEIKRLIDLTERKEVFEQETRSFEATTGTTFSLRSKEFAHDYRYFPEPDLQPVLIEKEYIADVKKTLPPLPDELFKKYTKMYGLSEYDSNLISDDKAISNYYEKLVYELTCQNLFSVYKTAANWLMGPIKSYLNKNAIEVEQFPIELSKLADLIMMIDKNLISYSVAVQNIFPELCLHPEKYPMKIAEEMNLIQESDSDSLRELAKQAIAKYPEKVAEYKNGKVGLIGLFMGEVMKLSKGKADPKIANQLVKEMLDKN